MTRRENNVRMITSENLSCEICGEMQGMGRTEDDAFGGREHVQGERHFVLVVLELEPADEGRDCGGFAELLLVVS